MKITWMGQAGFILKSEKGKTLGIDLYLSDCVERVEGHVGYHRLMPRVIEPEKLRLDVLIATHFHRDHFDIDSMYALMNNQSTRLICAKDCREDVENLHIDMKRTSFVESGDEIAVGGFYLSFVQCDHGKGAPEAVGVIVSVDNKHILFVGDSSLHLDWREEYLKEGPLDVLVAPINGAYGNLNEEDNVSLVELLRPKLAIPCHFGMFASHGGDPGLWKDIIERRLPAQQYKLFTMGECIDV